MFVWGQSCRLGSAPAAAAASSRWDQISPAGGALLLPGWDPARLPTHGVWEVPWTSWYGTMDAFCSTLSWGLWPRRSCRAESKVSLWGVSFAPVRRELILQRLGSCRAAPERHLSVDTVAIPRGWMTAARKRWRLGVKWSIAPGLFWTSPGACVG